MENKATVEANPFDALILKNEVIETLRMIYDPEIPINIYDMGLIYDLEVTPEGIVNIQMTLTTPACPVAGSLPGEVEAYVREIPGVKDVNLELVWDPPWTLERLSDEAKLELGLF